MLAFTYSGQGAQYPLMGKELYENFDIVRQTYEEASDSLSLDVYALSQDAESINLTKFTQPAILTLSVAIDRLLSQSLSKPEYVAGLSLGEYSALVKSGVFTFSQAVKFVHKRGEYMQNAVPQGVGKMLAVMNTPRDVVEAVCREASETAYVAPANYNMPTQLVIGGTNEGVELAKQLLNDQGYSKTIELQVSGPFHTQLLDPAAQQLKGLIKDEVLGNLTIPVISNTTAQPHQQDQIKEMLIKQVVSPVYWQDSIEFMVAQGVTQFVELGPGKTLTKFMKKIDKSVEAYNIENLASFEKVMQLF